MSPQPRKLFANETLYQLSYTPYLINGNNYRVKKMRGKIKTHALSSESGIAITARRGTLNFASVLRQRQPREVCQKCVKSYEEANL